MLRTIDLIHRSTFSRALTPLIHQNRSIYLRPLKGLNLNMEKYLSLPEFDPNFPVPNKNAKGFKPIVWVDCEMTGLNVFKDRIIEICCIITDQDLNILDPGYESVVHCEKSILDGMDEWCTEHHGKSGLTKKVLESTKSTLQVEGELLNYISKFTKKNDAVLAGNSIHMDRAFMMREFPSVLDHLHYRIIDVSSFFEFGVRFNQALISKSPKKKKAHTARADILESIAQLQWYRENFFAKPEK